jgi:hypothetical protein
MPDGSSAPEGDPQAGYRSGRLGCPHHAGSDREGDEEGRCQDGLACRSVAYEAGASQDGDEAPQVQDEKPVASCEAGVEIDGLMTLGHLRTLSL